MALDVDGLGLGLGLGAFRPRENGRGRLEAALFSPIQMCFMFQIILYFITVSKLPKSCSNGFPSFVFPLRCSTKAKKYVRRTGMNELDLPLGLQSYACVPSILLYGWTSFSPRRAFSESNPTINWVLVDHVTHKLPPIAVSFHHASRIILTSSSSCYRTSLPLWTGFRSAVCLTCGNGYREPIHCTAARVI